MNKSELARKYAQENGCTQAVAAETIKSVLELMVGATLSDGKAVFSPFKMNRKDRAARMGVNPRTQEKIEIGPSTTIKFKVMD